MVTTPDDLSAAHAHSINHQAEVLRSDLCGCFYCRRVFAPAEIKRWIDEESPEKTALCPHCGIDAVIGSASGIVMTLEFLERMNRHWFD